MVCVFHPLLQVLLLDQRVGLQRKKLKELYLNVKKTIAGPYGFGFSFIKAGWNFL